MSMKYILPIIFITIGIIVVGVSYTLSTQDVEAKPEFVEPINLAPEDLGDDDEIHLTFVSGTEYVPDDPFGMTLIDLRDFQGRVINTSCFVEIINPDRTIFEPQTLMTLDGNVGTYFQGFTTSTEQGIYEQNVVCVINSNKNLTGAKSFHVANISTIIQASEINIQQSIDTVFNALNCTLNPNVSLCNQLSNLQNLTTIIISQNNQTQNNINVSEEILIQINDSTTEQQLLFFDIEAPNCHVLTTWNFTARVTDERDHELPFLDCSLDSDRFGSELVSYNQEIDKYQTLHNCSAPAGIVAWNFTCLRNY